MICFLDSKIFILYTLNWCIQTSNSLSISIYFSLWVFSFQYVFIIVVKFTTYTLILFKVPSWRSKVYTSCYTMEGTEDLNDEVFNKRHQRFEIDERRRKRFVIIIQ